jgi:homocysteine S-methyltransferase
MTAITLLDGSVGQEIVHRHGKPPTNLWSTSVMMDAPEVVRAVHLDHFRAGATIATANTYALHRDRLDRAGIGDRFAPLIDTALLEAAAARDAHGSGRIAGSLGPLGASYRADLGADPATAAPLFAEIIAQMQGRVDLLLIETVAGIAQAQGALIAALASNIPTWLSLTVDDDDGTRLRSGEPLADIAPLLAQYTPQALLLNCSRPESIAAGLPILATLSLPFGAYANGFTHISAAFLQSSPTVDALTARRDLGPADYADFAMAWVDQGATILGGCCEVGPAHIAEIARRLQAAGHTIT